MNQVLLDGLNQSGLIVLELAVGFGLFWLGQLAYQKLFRRRMELNLELFVKDNPALVSFTQYGLVLLFSLVSLVAIRWLADLILVPGVKISDEIVHQEVPNLGAGLIEAFAYIAASFLIAWCFS